MGGGFGGGPAGFWSLILLVGLVLLAWGLFKVYRPGDRPQSGGDRAPEKILRERFARGELTEAEYRDRLEVLKDG